MKRFLACILVLALATLSCSILNPTAAPAATQSPGAAEAPPTSEAPPQPALPTETPAPPPTNAQCGPLSVYLPPGLASSYGCETFPEENDPDMPYFAVHP
jgi:hypothetical protein